MNNQTYTDKNSLPLNSSDVDEIKNKIEKAIALSWNDNDPIVEIRMSRQFYDQLRMNTPPTPEMTSNSFYFNSFRGVPIVVREKLLINYEVVRASVQSAFIDIKKDIQTVVGMLEGNVEKQKIINYIKKYLIK